MPTDLFTLRSDHVPTTARVVAFHGHEAISRPFHFEIFVIVPQADGELDPDALLGKPATLDINDGDGAARRWYHGVVASLELQHDLGVDLLYRLELVPRLWSLSLSHHSRVYANETFHKVVERVMKTADLKKDEDYSISFPPGKPYEHLTEYRESHFDFVSRVMEREGYYYYFEQRDDREFVVITNSKDQQPDCAPANVPFYAVGAADTSAVEALRSFRVRSVAMPTSVRLREYDPQQPDANLTGTSDVPHALPGQVDYFGDNYTSQGDGIRLAGYRKEEIQSRQKRFYGTGRVFNLASGHYFTLEEHGRLDGRYMAVELRHTGSNFAGAEEARERLGFDEVTYRVDVVAIPADQQFRPARATPVPRIYGVEEAVICGAASSPYAQIDSHGRYRVKIHFDEGDAKDGKASTWVRMIQPHGGNPEGHHFPLRKGTEVLLVYLGGDPDRPVIAGAAHNTNKPSVVTESNHTLNVIHTGSDNRIEMEDAQGAQYIDISTPPQNTHIHLGATHGPHTHNWVVSTDGTGLLHTGGNHDVTVDGAMTEKVHLSLEETYENTMKTTVTGAVTETYKTSIETTVTGPKTVTVDKKHTETVKGGRKQTINQGNDTTITDHNKVSISGGNEVDIKGGDKVTIMGGSTTSITGPTTITNTGALTQTITAGATITSPAGYNIIAPSKWYKVTAYSGEATGAKVGAIGFKAETSGVSIGVVGLKMDTTGVKIDFSGLKVDNYLAKADCGPIKLSTHGMALKKRALAITLAALIMMS